MNNSLKHLPIFVFVILVILTSLPSFFALLPNINSVSLQQQQSAYASSIKTDLKQEAKIYMNQDNFCNRAEGCKQATGGQQITGNDNTASGFNDQSKNIQQQQSALTPTPTPTPTPTLPSTLTVNKNVNCNFISSSVECPIADRFNITTTTNNGSSLSFDGSESGTTLRINPPFPISYQVTEDNPSLGLVIDTINIGRSPFNIAHNPDNGNLYVTNYDNSSVSVIDGATNTVVATIPVGTNPLGVAFNEDNGDIM